MDEERPSEICRVLSQNEIILRCSASGWFYYRNKMKYFTEHRYTDIERDVNSVFMDLVSLTSTRFEPREINGILMHGRNTTMDVKARRLMVSCYFSVF